jgi:hypothetical protein
VTPFRGDSPPLWGCRRRPFIGMRKHDGGEKQRELEQTVAPTAGICLAYLQHQSWSRRYKSIIRLFGLQLAVPDHTTLCGRAETLRGFRDQDRLPNRCISWWTAQA